MKTNLLVSLLILASGSAIAQSAINTLTANDTALCINEQLKLTASSNAPGSVFTFMLEGDTLQSGTDSTYTVDSALTQDDGTYTCIVDHTTLDNDSLSIEIHVEAYPNPSLESQAISLGQNASLNAGVSGTYLWSTGQTSLAISVSPETDQHYYLTVSSPMSGCTGYDSTYIKVVDGKSTITYEDFKSGLPSGWSIKDNSSSGFQWAYTDSLYPWRGYYSKYYKIEEFKSTSAVNGYMCLSGMYYNGDSLTDNDEELDSYFETGAFDCSSYNSVILEFEQYLMYSGSDDKFEVLVSNDGTNWTHFDAAKGIEKYSLSENAQTYEANISEVAGNENTVYLRFHAYDTKYYFWAVDDIVLKQPVDNDLQIEKVYHSFWSGGEDRGLYSYLPESQTMGVRLGVKVLNNGDANQHDVQFRVSARDSLVLFDQSKTYDSLIVGARDSLYLDTVFKPFPDGAVFLDDYNYIIEYIVSQSEDDFDLHDNRDTVYLTISDSVMARDHGFSTYLSSTISGFQVNDMFGTKFYVPNDDVVSSMSMYISSYTDANTKITGQLYRYYNGEWQLELSTDQVALTGNGGWLTLPFTSNTYYTNEIYGGTQYAVMVRYDGPEGNKLYVGADNTMDFDYSNAMALYMDAYSGATKWNYTSAVPKVRLNITPPWLGEKEIKAEDERISVQVYPNPCTDQLKLRYTLKDAGQLNIQIIDVNGQPLLLDELGAKNPGTYHETIHVSNLPAGVYFYRLSLGHTLVSGRFVKM
jgi:hypothetical protein